MARLQDETFDILVIGGGITGAGIARDAALRGFSTALVEKGDFASGTSISSAADWPRNWTCFGSR
jgi:glycerol-3-phosphate dehydrogenase